MPAIIEDEHGLLPPESEHCLQEAFCATLENEGLPTAFASVRIVNDEEILSLNSRMRKVDSVTDVLSFPAIRYPTGILLKDKPDLLRRTWEPDPGGYYLGDIALNVNRARKQAAEYGHSVNREIAYLCVHALLHLCGYDHMNDEDKTRMRSREKQVMNRIRLFRSISEE